MSTLSTKLLVLAFASVAIASQACTLASPTSVEMKPLAQDQDATEGDDDDADAKKGGSSSKASTCSAKFVKPDLATLKACGDGKGHCYAKEKMNSAMQAFFAADSCAGGEVCVDDEFIKAGGGELAKCKGLGGVGRCIAFELNAPMVATPEAAALKGKKTECDGDLVCVPCQNIQDNNADTGFCQPQGLMDAACSGGDATTAPKTTTPAKPAATCCGGKGTCMDGSGLGESAKQMNQDSCDSGLVCAPQSLVSGKAKTCKAGTLLGKGICMAGCFNDMLDTLGGLALDQATCDEGDLCVPCMFASKMAPEGVTVPGCE